MGQTLEVYSKTSAVLKNPSQKLTMNQLYEQRHETGDIKFVIGLEKIPAHRCVLAALSPKYKAQFYGAMAEKDVINVNDVSPAAFKEFLQFFYTDEVTLTTENIEDVLNLAKQSLVDDLVTECINFLFDVVGLDKLVRFHRLALVHDIKPLEEFCVKHIGANIKSVFKTRDFLSCEREMLCHILDLDSLNCNEIDVFDACIAWALAKCEYEIIDAASTANLRAALGDAIFKIRFCSMMNEQFATIDKNYSGLLSGQESIEVYRTIALKANGETSSLFGEKNGKPRVPILVTNQSLKSDCKFSEPKFIGNDDLFKSLVTKQKQTKWQCKDCMAQNDQTQSKCACCGGANRNATSDVNATIKTEPLKPTFSFGAFQSSSSSTVNLSSSQPGDAVFQSIVDKQKNSSWECSACLIRNDTSKSKCMCCGQSREVKKGVTANGTVPPKSQFSFDSKSADAPKTIFSLGSNANAKSSAPSSVASTFSFGNLAPKMNAQSSINFGNAKNNANNMFGSNEEKQKVSTWNCPLCMRINRNEDEKCASCVKPKPFNFTSRK